MECEGAKKRVMVVAVGFVSVSFHRAVRRDRSRAPPQPAMSVDSDSVTGSRVSLLRPPEEALWMREAEVCDYTPCTNRKELDAQGPLAPSIARPLLTCCLAPPRRLAH